MSKRTITDYEADMTKLEAAIRQTATMTVADPDLTPEGKKRRHQGWAKERKWAEQLEATATGMIGALEGAQTTANKARSAMSTMPAGDSAYAAEMRFSRRRARVDAALNAGGTDPLMALIAEADDTELPVLLEYANDHYRMKGGDLAKAGAEIIDQALQARSPEYAQAAQVAGQAAPALTIARERIAYMERLLDDPATQPPKEYDLASMSITGVVPEVSDLTA